MSTLRGSSTSTPRTGSRGGPDGRSANESANEEEVRSLYYQLLDGWNRRHADDMASLFAEDGNLVGFDGTAINGRVEITSHLQQIFTDHPTAAYVGKIREVRLLTAEVAILRSVAGMVPPGQSDLNPAVNAIQTLVAVRQANRWRVAVYHNTPAAFHGRPDMRDALTAELRQVLQNGGRASLAGAR